MHTFKKILVIGSANADLVIHTDKMPKLGETVVGRNFTVNAGGKGLNQAVAIAKLGGNVSFLGAVGKDAYGKMLLNTLNESGVEFVGRKDSETPTGSAIITVIDGNNFIVLSAGANDTLTPEFAENNSQLIMNADFIVLQLEIPIGTIKRICEIAKKGKARTVLNPAPYKSLPESLYPMIDYLIPNEHEARDITGITPDSNENCILAVKRLSEFGAKCVIITLGERGCVYSDGNKICFLSAVESTVVDTTSAGDSFIGALVTKIAENNALSDAITFANKVASITVSRRGAAKSIPFAFEINE